MIAAGLNRASAVIITYTDTASSLAVLSHVRALRRAARQLAIAMGIAREAAQ